MSDIGIVLLAAGEASRMGQAKQLLEYAGQPLIRHAAQTALASRCRPVVVVLGARAYEVRKALGSLPVEMVENPRWNEGMGTSIACGVQVMQQQGAAGAILMLADQPLVTTAMLDRLVELHETTGQPIVASEYSETVGVPVLFGRAFFENLLNLPPDQGCKKTIQSNRAAAILVACPEAEMDVDTPADYQRLRAMPR